MAAPTIGTTAKDEGAASSASNRVLLPIGLALAQVTPDAAVMIDAAALFGSLLGDQAGVVGLAARRVYPRCVSRVRAFRCPSP
jgi:hypothetical protein